MKFLLDVLQEEKQEEQVEPIQQQQTTGEKQEQLQELKKLKNFSFLDVGAGSGYFVSALLKEGLKASGIEISSEQVKFGNQMISEAFQNQFITPCKVQEAMHQVAEDGIADYIRNSKADVLSFIGVIEHMLNPHEALQAMLDNKNIKFIFFSVPTMSYSVMWEAVFPNAFNRHLGGAHTHIFTDSSINYLCKKYGMEKLGEWRFGADAADLSRMIENQLARDGNDWLMNFFHKNYYEILDNFQALMDKQHLCSETHIVASIQR